MQPALSAFFMLLFLLLCLLGILANGFIVLVLSRERMRRGRLLPSDMILISLGASHFCLQWVGMVNNFYYFLHLNEYSQGPAWQLTGLHWDFLNSATFWLGSWLSVPFCMKIANFTHPNFLWRKWRFPGSVLWLLRASLLISFIVTLLFFWGDHAVYQGFLIRKFPGNMTFKQWSRRLEIHSFLPLKLITSTSGFEGCAVSYFCWPGASGWPRNFISAISFEEGEIEAELGYINFAKVNLGFLSQMPMHEFVSGKSSVKKQASHVEKEMMEGSRFSGQKVPVSSAQHDT
ncbi:hypothetical protein GH733_013595, partial [Mirounga leonina]